MNLPQIFKLAERVRELTKHSDLVVLGSNAVLGLAEHADIPKEMAMSIDVDAYLKADPGRTGDLAQLLGEGSPFHQEVGIYLDPVSPLLPTLPEGWEARMIQIEQNGCRIWFIDPDDAAISKYARGEERDIRWIRAGLEAGLISMVKVQSRVGKATFLDQNEEEEARRRIAKDVQWLARIHNAPAS